MLGTRSKASAAVANGVEVAATPSSITYTNGPLPEVWIADGAAEEYSILILPDPKTSEPRRFVQRGCTSLGELRTFSSATPASFLVHPNDIPSHRGSVEVRTDDGEPTDPSDCDQGFVARLKAESLINADGTPQPWGDEVKRLADLKIETQEMIEHARKSAAERDSTAEEALAEEWAEGSRRCSHLDARIAYCRLQERKHLATCDNADELSATSLAKDCRAFTTKQTLYVVTEIDVIFTLLPVLCPTPAAKSQDDGFRIRFLPLEDIVEKWGDMEGSQATQLIKDRIWRDKIHEAVERISEVVEAGDEKAYGFSLDKFQTIVTEKAAKLADAGLPQSLDDHALRLAETTEMVMAADEEGSAETPTAVGTPGELSVATNDTQETAVSAVFTPRAAEDSQTAIEVIGKTDLQNLARMRVALGFILANYVPEHVSAEIVQRIDADASKITDFQALHDLLKRKRAADKRVDVSRLYAGKRSAEDEIRSEERAEKKRKLDEEEKKKKEASHGVKALAKVNVKGMSKMTSFFQAKSKR